MNKDFEFDAEESDFGEFEEELVEFDEFDTGEFDEIELQEVSIRTAILQKNNMLALLCGKTAEKGGAICRVDPREANPSVQLYDDPEKAMEWYTKSLKTSRTNGWLVVYDGLPLRG
jgi:hypothetical protein